MKGRKNTTWQVERNRNIQSEAELGNTFKIRMNIHAVIEHHDILSLRKVITEKSYF